LAKIEWSPVWSLRDNCFKYLPTSLLYFFYSGPAAFQADSNGCAAGNTVEEAIVQGFLELVERDAYAIWWYNQSQRNEVDLDAFNDSYVQDLKNQLADTGRKLWVLDVTSDLGVPTYVAILHWMQNGQENIEFGAAASGELPVPDAGTKSSAAVGPRLWPARQHPRSGDGLRRYRPTRGPRFPGAQSDPA
jgi:ribosomal protein S12 methylthiotransferase accessory factor